VCRPRAEPPSVINVSTVHGGTRARPESRQLAVRCDEMEAGGVLASEARFVVPTPHDLAASQPLVSKRARPRSGLLRVLLPRQPLPLNVGIAVATAFIIAETMFVAWFQDAGSEKSFRALFLLGVLVISAAWRFGLALATTLVSAAIYFYFHLDHGGPIGIAAGRPHVTIFDNGIGGAVVGSGSGLIGLGTTLTAAIPLDTLHC
jgi:hypothetical protein